uniref:Low-density lipoprotein receptor domain class A n=1 Tax=Rhabditophanes sp. KR3021 TaxID=114890 RepID=A0AC35U5R8_9BILA
MVNEIGDTTTSVDGLNSTFNFNWTSLTETSTTPKQRFINCDIEFEIACSDNLECIKKSFMCDGYFDCYDRSDEAESICPKQRIDSYLGSRGRFKPPTVKCPQTWFFCSDGLKCIEPQSVCNYIQDCQ